MPSCAHKDRNGVFCREELGKTDATTSRFCDKHTCPYVEYTRDGPVRCRGERKGKKWWCKPHWQQTVCSYTECDRRRNWPEPNIWLCKEHDTRCATQYCDERVKFAGSRFCKYHMKCNATGCENLPNDTENSNYCVRHTCIIGDCVYQALANRRCSGHRPCPVGGCEKFCETSEDMSIFPKYCSDHNHTCSLCDTIVDKGVSLCQKHRCNAKGCQRESRPGSSYCEKHVCCKIGCEYPGVVGSDEIKAFCRIHKCRDLQCTQESREEGGFCADKHACVADNSTCLKKRAEDESGETKLCLTHDRDLTYRTAHQKGWDKAQDHVRDADSRNQELRKQIKLLETRIAQMEVDRQREKDLRERLAREQRDRDEQWQRQRRSRTMPHSSPLSSSDEWEQEYRASRTWGGPNPDASRNRHSGFYPPY